MTVFILDPRMIKVQTLLDIIFSLMKYATGSNNFVLMLIFVVVAEFLLL